MARPVKTKIGDSWYCYDLDDWCWVGERLVPRLNAERYASGELSYEQSVEGVPEDKRVICLGREKDLMRPCAILADLQFIEAAPGTHHPHIETLTPLLPAGLRFGLDDPVNG